VAGLHALHRRWGKLPWPSLVEPARQAAAEGVTVTPQLARAIALTWPQLDAVAQQTFGLHGKPLQSGERLIWPSLAATLAQIAADPLAMHHGPIADDIVETVAAHGGKLALTDLSGYRVLEVAPLGGSLGGHQAWTMPSPSAGGAQVLAMAEWLQLWRERQDSQGGQGEAMATADAHPFVEAMRRSFLLRLRHPASEPRAGLDAVYPPAERQLLGVRFDPHHAIPTATLQAALDAAAGGKLEDHANTSHVAIIDRDGLAVSSTHTVNLLLGAGIVTRRTGILLNNEMDDFSMTVHDSNAFGLAGSVHHLARPLARPVSSMSPLVVMQGPPAAPGQVALIVGSPGGTRIPTTVLQVVDRTLRGWPLDRAVAAARVHHQALPDVAWVEEGQPGNAVAAVLQQAGHAVQRQAPWCNVQAISAVPAAGGAVRWHAVADPRGEGAAWAD
jgi:gamma-glutamyltranspeptidase/glutathione hydrolase